MRADWGSGLYAGWRFDSEDSPGGPGNSFGSPQAGAMSMMATDVLRRDHRHIRGLFARYRRTPGGAFRAKLELFCRIKRTLRLHHQIEEELFYPALHAAPDGSGPWEAALDAHFTVERLLSELSTMGPRRREYDGKIEELRRSVDRHVRREERELFREARRRLSGALLEKLGAEMQARKFVVESPLLYG